MTAATRAFYAGVVASALGAIVSWNRGEHTTWQDEAAPTLPAEAVAAGASTSHLAGGSTESAA